MNIKQKKKRKKVRKTKMVNVEREITKDQYDRWSTIDRDTAEMECCGAEVCCGYGLYSFALVEDNNGKYFVQYSRGDSCD